MNGNKLSKHNVINRKIALDIDESAEISLKGIRIARVGAVSFALYALLSKQIEYLSKIGMKVLIISNKSKELEQLHEFAEIRYKVVNITRSIDPIRDIMALCKLYYIFRREKIQISHSTSPKAGFLVSLASYLAGVPIRLHTFTGQPWISMRGVQRIIVRYCDRIIGFLNTRCYADSFSQRQFLISEKIIQGNRIFVVGAGSLSGVDTRRFNDDSFPDEVRSKTRLSLGIPENVAVILFFGRITADKGIRELLQAFNEIKNEGEKAHLVFVGRFDGESGVPGEISKEEIEQVSDTHIVNYPEYPEEYVAIASFLCLPSYREGFGTVVIEAAAMGVPALGTDIYGLKDSIIDGETGLIVPVRNAKKLAEGMRKLLADKELLYKLGVTAKLRARSLFDSEIINAQVSIEYFKLCKLKNCLKT